MGLHGLQLPHILSFKTTSILLGSKHQIVLEENWELPCKRGDNIDVKTEQCYRVHTKQSNANLFIERLGIRVDQ